MRILLVRHAETDWNREGRCQGSTDLELNATGREQAERLASRLARRRLTAIYSSALKRARQTAEAIRARHPHLELHLDNDLRELDHGHLEGLTFLEIRARYPAFTRAWRACAAEVAIPGGERLTEVAARAWCALERIAASGTGTVAVVTHNFPILAILCRITGTDLNHYRAFQVAPCDWTEVVYGRGRGWKLAASAPPWREGS
jgi:broad specificity phosphatase PhoE